MERLVRPESFDSYASRIGWNLLANLVWTSDDAVADPATQECVADFRCFLARLYRDIHLDPQAWGLPCREIRPGDPRSCFRAPVGKLEPWLKALVSLGCALHEGPVAGQLDRSRFEALLGPKPPKGIDAFLRNLGRVGVTIHEDSLLSPDLPSLATGLSLMARAASQRREAFLHFVLGRPRILSGVVSWGLEDALATAPERDAEIARRLDGVARGLGCRLDLLPPTPWWGEQRGAYKHRRSGLSLLAFVVQEGVYEMRLPSGDTKASLAVALAEPREFREWFISLNICVNCGGCAGGFEVDVDGHSWTLCHTSWGRSATPPYGHIESVERLMASRALATRPVSH